MDADEHDTRHVHFQNVETSSDSDGEENKALSAPSASPTSSAEEGINIDNKFPPKPPPLREDYRPFVEKHEGFVKTSKPKTKSLILTYAYRLADCLGEVDKVSRELVQMVESLRSRRNLVCPILAYFVGKGMTFREVELTAEAVNNSGKESDEVIVNCDNAYSILSFTCDPKAYASEYIKVVTELKGNIREILQLVVNNGLVTSKTYKSGTPLLIFTAVNKLGENRENVCALAGSCISKDEKTPEIVKLLKDINKLYERKDKEAVLGIAREIKARFMKIPMSKCIDLAIKLGESWKEVIELFVESGLIKDENY